jgi:hypothetical protein
MLCQEIAAEGQASASATVRVIAATMALGATRLRKIRPPDFATLNLARRYPGWRLAVLLLAGAVSVLSTHAEPPSANTPEARVRELQAKSSEVKVTLWDNTVLQGRILRAEADSFTIRQRRTGQQVAIQYAQVKEVKKSGLPRRAKAVLIPSVIGGCAFVVLCAAPHPIGFLCRKDPS